jgi:hypothetical protein
MRHHAIAFRRDLISGHDVVLSDVPHDHNGFACNLRSEVRPPVKLGFVMIVSITHDTNFVLCPSGRIKRMHEPCTLCSLIFVTLQPSLDLNPI